MKLFNALTMGWLVWVWKHTPDCAAMSRLASRSLEQRLPLRTRLQIRLHFLICTWCRRYSRQLQFLHAAAPRLDFNPALRGLSPEARGRIVRQLRASAHPDACQ